MKETIISNCEKAFILKAISDGRRLDGRRLKEYRDLEVQFGVDYGSCQVSLGETRVLAQVSCDIQQPKATRPNEGMLHINVGLSPMGAPHFETGRQSDTSIQLNRLLEKCIKDSKCVDLESLCIVAEEKVWVIRIDLNILNHEGNLVDCASVAALAAISHFRRPDVELFGEKLTIYEASVRDPIPLSIRHYPVCVSFAIFSENGNIFAVDPTDLEGRVAEAELTLGVNGYRELCGVHLGGSTQSGPQLVEKCAKIAANRAVEVVKIIKEAVVKDSESRAAGEAIGFVESVRQGKLTSHGVIPIRPRNWKSIYEIEKAKDKEDVENEVDEEEDEEQEIDETTSSIVQTIGPGTAVLGTPGTLALHDVNKSSDSDSDVCSVEMVKELTYEDKLAVVENIVLSGDSEEETTVTLHPEQMSTNSSLHMIKNVPEKQKKKRKKKKKPSN